MGLDRADGFDEPERLVLVRVGEVVLHQVGPALHHQAVHVHEPEMPAGVLAAHAFFHEGGDHQIRDARGRGAGTEEHDAQLGEFELRDARGGAHARERNGRGALNVVVEAEHTLAVTVEQRVGVGREEVFELDERVGVLLLHRSHELFDEREVALACDALARISEVEHVVANLLVVGAYVEHHGEAVLRRYAGTGAVERELADGDAHAVGAEVAQAEDALPVGHDDDADVLLAPVVEDLRDPALVVGRDEEALRLARDVRELFARFAHGRRVDQRQNLFDVVDHGAVEEMLVALLQGRQRHVPVDVSR